MILKRFLAFLIDYLIIVLYALILFGASQLTIDLFSIQLANPTPVKGQLIGLLSMTIPMFLYFYLMESGKSHATSGKRLMKIYVDGSNENYFIRNLLKFLPWKIAHLGVHWIIFYTSNNLDVPIWNWIALIFPQLIVVVYLLSILFFKGRSSLYDQLAKAKVMITL